MSPLRRRLLRLAPLSAFALSFSALWVLQEHISGQKPDSPSVRATLPLGMPVPKFNLPSLAQGPDLGSDDLPAAGKPVLLNFFASWCAPCEEEMPVLLTLRQRGLAIWGIAYRDRPDAALAFLQRLGNPYQRSAHDEAGSSGPAFDLSGVPESILIDADGIIRWRWSGGLSQEMVERDLMPLLRSGT